MDLYVSMQERSLCWSVEIVLVVKVVVEGCWWKRGSEVVAKRRFVCEV